MLQYNNEIFLEKNLLLVNQLSLRYWKNLLLVKKISNLLFEGMLKFVAKKLLKYVLNLFHHSLHVNLFWKGLLIFLKKLIPSSQIHFSLVIDKTIIGVIYWTFFN